MPTTSITRWSRPRPPKRRRRRIRCRRIACGGNTSSGSTSCATATSRRRRGGSTCIAARCSVSSPSAPLSSESIDLVSDFPLLLRERAFCRGEGEGCQRWREHPPSRGRRTKTAKSELKPAGGVEVALQPERCGAGEGEHHGLAACRRDPLLHTLAHEL